ncbi:hypothetical protein NA647_12890 [Pseudomonas stutzeri]|nr:hypothetical protein [Stutzerimonas stutzeri]MCQ4288323.1 hypothetical protein [Stutzerimonas stutzeri]
MTSISEAPCCLHGDGLIYIPCLSAGAIAHCLFAFCTTERAQSDAACAFTGGVEHGGGDFQLGINVAFACAVSSEYESWWVCSIEARYACAIGRAEDAYHVSVVAVVANTGRAYAPAVTPAIGGTSAWDDPDILIALHSLASGKGQREHHFIRLRADALLDSKIANGRHRYAEHDREHCQSYHQLDQGKAGVLLQFGALDYSSRIIASDPLRFKQGKMPGSFIGTNGCSLLAACRIVVELHTPLPVDNHCTSFDAFILWTDAHGAIAHKRNPLGAEMY